MASEGGNASIHQSRIGGIRPDAIAGTPLSAACRVRDAGIAGIQTFFVTILAVNMVCS
jgi:hypothetical protein